MAKVPFVIYIDGERKVIGEAEVDAFGTMFAKINEDGSKWLGVNCGDFSIGWTSPSIDHLRDEHAALSAGLVATLDADSIQKTISALAAGQITSAELARLDFLHSLIGLQEEWMNSTARRKLIDGKRS